MYVLGQMNGNEQHYLLGHKEEQAVMYVNNNELLIEVRKYKESGKMSERLGEMILMIARNYATKGSYAGYTWVEDFIAEAALTCVRYLKSFDENKYAEPNPFAYITTICRNAFIAYIRDQKKHSGIKNDLYFEEHHILQDMEPASIDYTEFR
jgi:DNA-directed RNA polymerase specialized sigma24 family protein